ncbi:MAG: MBOAT family protein [Acidobacteria bacterium]|nr:MBOAT family protein [Acidobacteriota bacterium]
MALTSPEYLCFLCIVFAAYWLTSAHRTRLLALVALVNLFFLWRWSWKYALLVPLAAGIDCMIADAIHLAKPGVRRKSLLALSVEINLGLILLSRLAGGGWELSLSFYAFQALTYTIDVYRGDSKPTPTVLHHLASVCFFPGVLAGPITRISTLTSQWDKIRAPLDDTQGSHGLFLIGLGAVKKFLVADYLANNLVERVFDTPKLYSAAEVLAGVYGYTFQIYYDFSGYTDIAIGSALLLGIKLPPNFNRPYAAPNVADFWRRWHITLSNWLRDYLYFSLPGQRSKWGQYLNLVITMLLGGLWHGLNWTFLVWGGLHGVALAATRAWQTWRRRRGAPAWIGVATTLATFHFVAFAWIFFRSVTIASALDVLAQFASLTSGTANLSTGFLLILAVAIVFHYLPGAWYDIARIRFAGSPAPVQAAVLVLLTLGIQYTVSTGAAPFIYQKF